MSFIRFLSLSLVTGSLAQPPLRQQFPWYHTNDEIHSQLAAVANSCTGAEVTLSTRTVSSGSDQAEFDVVYVKRGSSEGKNKAFFVFGEHARELVTTETALQFLQTLCGSGDGENHDLVEKVLGSTNFVLLPNANPFGRKRVFEGDYCKRTNEDSVDLNRNWEDGQASSEETNPGPHAFSEPETQIIRDLVAEEKPDVFLSVHSGAYLLATPFGTESKVPVNEQQMLDVLGPLSQTFCSGDCPYGALADVIGYKSQGCDIDYVKDHLDTPYAFTWEIYTSPDLRQFYAEKAHARAEGRPIQGAAQTFFSMNGMMLLQAHNTSNATYVASQDDMDCFKQFNPPTEQETQSVTQNWAKAFLSLCDSLPSSASGKRTSVLPSPPDPTSQEVSATSPAGALSRLVSLHSESASSVLPRNLDSSSGSSVLSRDLDFSSGESESPLTKFLH